jgi:hypothetical protein
MLLVSQIQDLLWNTLGSSTVLGKYVLHATSLLVDFLAKLLTTWYMNMNMGPWWNKWHGKIAVTLCLPQIPYQLTLGSNLGMHSTNVVTIWLVVQPSSNFKNGIWGCKMNKILSILPTSLHRGYKQRVSLYTEQSMHNLNVLQQHCVKDTYPVAL